jgi:biotin carboxyl carrier protein
VTFEIEVNGRMRSVAVERSHPGRYRVSIDGTVHEVDAARVDEHGLSLLLDGASRDVHVVPNGSGGHVLVSLEGRMVPVVVNGRRTRRGPGAAASLEGEQRIVAPMPGRVVRILAAEGDDVSAGQAVVVIEAMKMENELRAPRAGRIKQVTVAEGSSVEGGRVLVVME